ncbi:MAG: hypothetical protein P8010_15525, partial [Desulfosarcinaceae bacterium]
PGNPMAWIMSVEPLTGANYPQWREKINMGLALFEIDKAITDKRPVEPTLLDIPDDLGADAKAEREKQNSKLMSCYEIDKINWERSNRKCLMVIKERISEGIRGAIPDCETAVEYLEKVESQFTGSSKAYASSLIKRLISEKYTGTSWKAPKWGSCFWTRTWNCDGSRRRLPGFSVSRKTISAGLFSSFRIA